MCALRELFKAATTFLQNCLQREVFYRTSVLPPSQSPAGSQLGDALRCKRFWVTLYKTCANFIVKACVNQQPLCSFNRSVHSVPPVWELTSSSLIARHLSLAWMDSENLLSNSGFKGGWLLHLWRTALLPIRNDSEKFTISDLFIWGQTGCFEREISPRVIWLSQWLRALEWKIYA